MASTAHAFFCFEVLTASFGNTPHPNLREVLELYEKSGIASKDEGGRERDAHFESAVKQMESLPQSQSVSRLQASDPPARSESSTPSTASIKSQMTSTSTDITTNSTYSSKLNLTESYPLFVTWNLMSRSGHKTLRGCIGTFESLPLEKGLEQYALTSAFEDTRFSPIPASIVPNLACSLTLLADFEDCKTPMDWCLGTHGIRISFTHRYRRHGATYLPDVAVEQGWTKEQTLESLMRKAGWESSARHTVRGGSRPWEFVKDFRVIRYTGLKASASYTEWQEWRESITLET